MEKELKVRVTNRKIRQWIYSFMNKKNNKNNNSKQSVIPEITVSNPSELVIDPDEMSERFEKFLEDMNIPDDKKLGLRKESYEKKCQMISNSVFGSNRSTSDYVKSLNRILIDHPPEDQICKTLNAVRICLNSCPVSWIKEFNNTKYDGLNLLLKVFNLLTDSWSSALVCLKCLRAFANCGYGFHKLMENENAFLFIANCLKPNHHSLMHIAVEMLTIHTFFNPHIHQAVLDAMFKAGKLNNYDNRFIPLIRAVENITVDNERDSLGLACIRFINVIVSPEFLDTDAPPLDEYYRLHLRREFVSYGLLQAYDRLLANPKLKLTHVYINQFLQEFETDEDDTNEKSEIVIRAFADTSEIFRILNRSTVNTSCETHFRSILSSLIMIRDDPLKEQLFRFIDQVVTEIILQDDNGFCPDPELQKFNMVSLRNLLVENHIAELRQKLDTEKLKNEECLMKLELSKTPQKFPIENKVDGIPPTPEMSSEILIPPPPPNLPPPPPPPPGPSLIGGIRHSVSIKKPTTIMKQFGMTRKVYQPKQPMKKANWNKINEKILNKKSIWISINEELIPSDIFMELENNFASKVVQDRPDSSRTDIIAKNLKILDMKTAQNISILLGSFRMDYERLKQAILEIDTSILTQVMIEQLLKNLPEPEQMQKISELATVYTDLSESEQFCFQLSSIGKLKPRLESILFQLRFEDKITEIKGQYHEAEMALTEILKSPGLKKILEIVLSLGNYMNSGSRNEQSIGFELGFLCKLSSTKDKSNNKSLIHFLAEIIMKFFFNPHDLSSELSYIDKASRLALDVTNSSLTEIRQGLKALVDQLKFIKSTDDRDRFVEKMRPFIHIVQEQISIAQLFQTKMNESFDFIGEYFSFSATTYKMEDLFSDIFKFKTEFLEAHRFNEEAKLVEERTLKAKLDKERRAQEKQTTTSAHSTTTTSEEASGVLDNLLMVLKSGDGSITPKRHKAKEKNRDKRNRARTRVLFNENMSNNMIQIAS